MSVIRASCSRGEEWAFSGAADGITAHDFNRSRLLIRWKAGYAENGSHARHVANASANMAVLEI